MKYTIGAFAGGAALVMALTAGCSGSGAKSGTGGSGSGGSGSGGSAVQLSPVAEIQNALTKADSDQTVTVHGTITTAQGSGTMSGQERFGSNFGIAMNLTLSGQSIQEVWTGDVIYMKIPQLSGELGGKPWASIDLGSLSSSDNLFSTLIVEMKNSDPAEQMQPLLASGDLKLVGTETVNGEQATHYHGTVDPATALTSAEASKNLTSAQITQLKTLFSGAGVKNDVMDVWIDGSGRLVKEQVVETSTAGTTTVVMNLTGWGQPVDITPPPASQVGNLNSLLGGIAPSKG